MKRGDGVVGVAGVGASAKACVVAVGARVLDGVPVELVLPLRFNRRWAALLTPTRELAQVFACLFLC